MRIVFGNDSLVISCGFDQPWMLCLTIAKQRNWDKRMPLEYLFDCVWPADMIMKRNPGGSRWELDAVSAEPGEFPTVPYLSPTSNLLPWACWKTVDSDQLSSRLLFAVCFVGFNQVNIVYRKPIMQTLLCSLVLYPAAWGVMQFE